MDLVVYDVHNYLTCDFGNGPITVDITFPQNLTALGLPVTDTWNGTEDFKLCCTPEQSIEVKRDKIAPSKTLASSKSPEGKLENAIAARKVIEQHRKVLIALRDR